MRTLNVPELGGLHGKSGHRSYAIEYPAPILISRRLFDMIDDEHIYGACL